MNQSLKKIIAFRPIIQLLGVILTVFGIIGGYSLSKAIILILTVLVGPIFCGWLCPFGTLQDIIAYIGKKLKIKRRTMPKLLHKILLPLRYILLVITTLLALDLIFTLLSYDPRANFTSFLSGYTIAIVGWIVIGIFLLISLFFYRPFCQYGCVEGARYGLLSIIRPITILRNEDSCIDCGKCNRSCPMQIDIMNNPTVRSLQCTNCMTCVSNCPIDNTLTVGLQTPKKIHWTPVKFLIILLALSFLGSVVIVRNFNNTSKTDLTVSVSSDITGAATGVNDGTYIGSGSGFRGDITAQITVKNQQITNIVVTSHNDDAQWFDRAYNTIVSSIITLQETDVDNVSGATYSSMGIKEAVANALLAAGSTTATPIETTEPTDKHGDRRSNRNSNFTRPNSEITSDDTTTTDSPVVDDTPVSDDTTATDSPVVDDTPASDDTTTVDSEVVIDTFAGYASGVADGTYTGNGSGFRGTLTVEVSVVNEQITGIEVVSSSDDTSWLNRAIDGIISSIISDQTADVDNVSGATYSSMGIKEAVANAMVEAGSTTAQPIENNTSNRRRSRD